MSRFNTKTLGATLSPGRAARQGTGLQNGGRPARGDPVRWPSSCLLAGCYEDTVT